MFDRSCAFGMTMLTWALVAFGLPTHSAAGTLLSPSLAERFSRSGEPFGQEAYRLTAGVFFENWRTVQQKLEEEQVQLALCERDRVHCSSPPALRFLAIVEAGRAKDGRARLGEINRAINLAVQPVSDLARYGSIDVWASPLDTFSAGKGDCEDYAIAKFVALREAGISPDDLRIVIMRHLGRNEDHAIAAVRLEGRWLTLDNRHMAIVEDRDVTDYQPLFLLDQHGIMRYRDAPLLPVGWQS